MGVWEYGLVKEVCLLEEEVCLWGMYSTVSIHIHGRKIYQQQQQQQHNNNNNNNNNDDNNNDDHRDGDHNIDDDVVGEEEVKVTKDVVVEGW